MLLKAYQKQDSGHTVIKRKFNIVSLGRIAGIQEGVRVHFRFSLVFDLFSKNRAGKQAKECGALSRFGRKRPIWPSSFGGSINNYIEVIKIKIKHK